MVGIISDFMKLQSRQRSAMIIIMSLVLIISTVLSTAKQRIASEAFATTVTQTKFVNTTAFVNHATWVNAAGKGEWKALEVTEESQDRIWNPSPKSLIVSYPGDPTQMTKGTVLATQKGYFIAISSLEKAFKMPCGFDLNNMSVGYLDRADVYFLNALAQGYHMDLSTINYMWIPPTREEIMNIATRLKNDLDIVITYLIPKSPLHRLIQGQTVSIMGFKNLDIQRIKIFAPYIDIEPVNLKSMFFDIGGSAAAVLSRESETKLPYMISSIVQIAEKPKPKSILDATFEGFINNYEMDPESLDPAYRCYGDETQTSKQMCESKYDPIGLPKKVQTVWDKPCIVNSDCPFWDKTQKRGGCNKQDGTCEMPVAVRRTAYRKYDASGINEPFKKNDKYIFSSG